MRREEKAFKAWKHKLDNIFSLVLGGVTLLIFLMTMSRGVFPGASASLMATYAGLEPEIAPAHPIWGTMVGWLAGDPVSALRLNFFSVLCGTLAVVLFYRIVSAAVFQLIEGERESSGMTAWASVVAGVVAAIGLGFSVPIWMVSTRLHYQSLDLLLLMALCYLFVSYMTRRKLWLGLLFALFCGVVTAESIIVLPVLPIFLMLILYSDFRFDRIRLGRLALMGVFAVLGLGLLLLSARKFCATGDLTLRGYSDYWGVVRTMASDHIRAAKAAMKMHQLGGFLVIMPWLAVILAAQRALNRPREWGLYIFHGAITIITLFMISNAPASPWGIQRAQGGLPIMLYTMIAMVAGYLVAYWIQVLAKSREDKKPNKKTSIGDTLGVLLSYVSIVLILITVLATSVINGFEASGRRGDFADQCAAELLDHMEGRTWLVTDGMFDNHLIIEAARRKQPLKLLSLQKNDSPIYIRQVKQMVDSLDEFPESERIRYKNSLDLGVVSFVQDWIADDPSLAERMVVMSAPDLIVGADWTVAPLYFGFIGVRDSKELEDVDFLAEYDDFWRRMRGLLARSRGVRDPVAEYRAAVRRQVGFVANNTGVLLEDLGRREEAYHVYQQARLLDIENISALLNMAEMLNRDPEFKPEDKDLVESELKEFVDNMARRLPIWALSRYYGYVRSPLLFAQLGWTWALSGQPGMAMAGLKRAEAMADNLASRTRLRSDMADLLVQHGDEERGVAIYEEILKSEPDNQQVLLAMAQMEARHGAFDKALEWLERASETGVDRVSLAMSQAAIDLAANNSESARIKLTEVTELQPKNLQALGMLAVAVMQMKEFDEVERRILPRMESVAGTPDNYLIQVTRGQLYYQKGRDFYKMSRDAFERATVLRPGLPMLLEWVLRLDFLIDDKVAAENHARQILRINRNHGFANYVMGSLMLWRNRREEAEDYLRRSVKESKSAAALNDLAELLRKSGNLEEAERQARAAIEMAPDMYFAWDTLGGVLSDTERLDDAEAAYSKALEIFSDDLRVHLNLAKLLLRKNDKIKAREIVNRIVPRRSELPAEERAELDKLIRDLTPGAR